MVKKVNKSYDLIYFIGDSFTLAKGMAEDEHKLINFENRFSGLVSKHYNIREVNRASAGCGNHYIARKLYTDIQNFVKKNLNPLVVISYTDYNRVEVYSNKKKDSATISPTFSYFKDYMVDSYNPEYNLDCSKYYINSIRSCLNNLNLDFIETSSLFKIRESIELVQDKFILPDLQEIAGPDGCFVASDGIKNWLGHPNVMGHKRIAKKIIEKIDSLYFS